MENSEKEFKKELLSIETIKESIKQTIQFIHSLN